MVRTKRARSGGFLLGRNTAPAVERRIGFAAGETSAPEHNDLIHYAGDAPIITLASTGAGKTSGPVICNMLHHPGQAICLDVKGKVYDATAAHRRRMGQKIHVLDLRDGQRSKCALNPFHMAQRLGSEIAATSRSFAAELVPARETFWSAWAQTMVSAGLAFLWQHRPREEHCLSMLYEMYTRNTDYNLAVYLDTMQSLNKMTRAGWGSYLELPDRETRPSVLGSTLEYLQIFDSDLVRRLTDTTTIDLDALVAGKPMTIYITIPPYRLAAYSPILRLWIAGLMNLLGTRERCPASRTLMLVDEAGQLGHMQSLITASTLMREYGLTIWTIWQNAAQLEIYGTQARTLIDNAGVLKCFGLRNARMAQEIAALVGGITADQLMAIGKDDQMLAIEGDRPRIAASRSRSATTLKNGLPTGGARHDDAVLWTVRPIAMDG